MARIRNFYGLIGSRDFFMPTHEQRFMFFSLEDVNNGSMDDWMKSVKITQWQRYDNENCTIFYFVSLSSNPNAIRKIFDDSRITVLIDIARIGILARLNEMLYMFGLLPNGNAPPPNTEEAKKQTIRHMIHMVTLPIINPNPTLPQIKTDETNTIATGGKLIEESIFKNNSSLKRISPNEKKSSNSKRSKHSRKQIKGGEESCVSNTVNTTNKDKAQLFLLPPKNDNKVNI